MSCVDLRQARVVLIRHTEVHSRYRGICYGASDVELSEFGVAQIMDVGERLANVAPRRIVHSGLQRTRRLAEHIAAKKNMSSVADPRIGELDFGVWELQPWSEIYGRHGNDMSRIVSDPDAEPPHGGETVMALRKRFLVALREYHEPEHFAPTIFVTHGGVISAVIGTLEGLPVGRWPERAPKYGQVVGLGKDDVDVLLRHW